MKVWCLLTGLAALIAPIPRAGAADASDQFGAAIPWITCEAENAKTNATILKTDFTGNTPAREASGRQCVRLGKTGDFVEFSAQGDAQGIVIRYSIPDSPSGRGIDATLSWSINGKSQQKKLAMTSRFSHLYGQYPFKNEPGAGTPRNFWDELRVIPETALHAGDVIRLQRNPDDTAAEYLIDFIDLEIVPAPIAQPADSLSITDFGATSNDQTDDGAAFVAAIAAAKSQHKSVWIPAGQFTVRGSIDVSDIAILGAGMWYSTLMGVDDYKPENRIAFLGRGSHVTLSDFAIVGKLNYRNDAEGNDGLGESFGTGSVIRNIWVEHTKAGAWIVNSDGLLVEGCRFRNTIADGINLCVGMRNTIVRNCTARGTGDDCFAMWPATYSKSMNTHGENKFVHCTAQLPFLAQAFAIYGGENNAVENCEATDIPYGAGLYASTTFPTEFGFRGMTTYRNVRLTRTGDGDGAIGTVANVIDLTGVHFDSIEVFDSPRSAIQFTSMHGQALRDATFDRVKISGAEHAVVATSAAVGSATMTNVSAEHIKSTVVKIDSPKFELIRGTGNAGFDEDRESNAGR